jgi:hypothetical protein
MEKVFKNEDVTTGTICFSTENIEVISNLRNSQIAALY